MDLEISQVENVQSLMRNLFSPLKHRFSQYSLEMRQSNTACAREDLLHCLNDDLDMISARPQDLFQPDWLTD